MDLANAVLRDAQSKAASLAAAVHRRLGAATAISEGRIKNLGSSIGVVSESPFASDRDTRYQAAGEDLLRIPPLKLQAAIDVIFEMKGKPSK
ncbi:MAG: hypothetical protein HYZ65_01130 [Burkholderiales bacterium]|nr:hypothetical protein [Burkholderiales bacterium]